MKLYFYLFLFLAALIPRILDLGLTLNVDASPWYFRSLNFLIALRYFDFGETFQSAHPGVTLMWLSGLSLKIANYLGFSDTYNKIFMLKLPIAIITSLTVILTFYFIQKIFKSNKLAFISAILIAFDPFFLAHSRHYHLDALLTSFMFLSVISLVSYLNNHEKKNLFLASFFLALSILTKTPALFLVPFFLFMLILDFFLKEGVKLNSKLVEYLKIFLVIGIISFLIFYLLFPAMYLDPFRIIKLLFYDSTHSATTFQELFFFMGKIGVGSPGALYYTIAILYRLTPLTLILFFFAIIYISYTLIRKKIVIDYQNILILISFVFLFTLFMSLCSIKGDRYILPIFPFVDILAAFGFCIITEWIAKLHLPIHINKSVKSGLIYIIMIVQFLFVFSLHPHYESHYSRLFGGPTHAQKLIDIGYGEGLEQAAKYLNKKENSENLKIATHYEEILEIFFKGKVLREKVNKEIPDYRILYINQVQRYIGTPIVRFYYKNQTPEYVVNINGIDYAWVYKAVPEYEVNHLSK